MRQEWEYKKLGSAWRAVASEARVTGDEVSGYTETMTTALKGLFSLAQGIALW